MIHDCSTGLLKRGVAMGATALVAIHVVGTVGFYVIGDEGTSVFDASYMTFITFATIGDAETVIPQQGQTPVPILLQRLVDD